MYQNIDNPDTRILALASKNIGNDKTHYIVKHPDYTLDDLRAYIQSAESFINDKLETLDAEKIVT